MKTKHPEQLDTPQDGGVVRQESKASFHQGIAAQQRDMQRHPAPDGAPKARILVVDDDDIVRGLHECVLHLDGYETNGVPDGEVALEALATTEFDLIITDRNMPRLDGIGLVRAIRASGIRTPVMMVSGSLAVGDVLPGDIAHEFVIALPKPVGVRDLLAGVAFALRTQPKRPSGARRITGIEPPAFG